MGESRQELIAWVNDLLQYNLTKVEQCGTGAPVCQIYDSIYRDMPMSRVKFNVNAEYAYIENWKLLTAGFKRWGLDREINIMQLTKCKMQDNLEFLQWTKRHWDQYFPGDEYDAIARRKGAPGGGGAAPLPPKPVSTSARTSTSNRRTTNSTTPTVTAASRARPGMSGVANAGASAALKTENTALRKTVGDLEKERDFYFSKLREIELLMQQVFEEQPELESEENLEGTLHRSIRTILYSTEEGFEIPADADGEEVLEQHQDHVDGQDMEHATEHAADGHDGVDEEETF